MTLCPKCGKPGGVLLFTSIGPCDACLAPVRAPERAAVTLTRCEISNSRFAQMLVCTFSDGTKEGFPFGCSSVAVMQLGLTTLRELVHALSGSTDDKRPWDNEMWIGVIQGLLDGRLYGCSVHRRVGPWGKGTRTWYLPVGAAT
jgi:hypothetical protein